MWPIEVLRRTTKTASCPINGLVLIECLLTRLIRKVDGRRTVETDTPAASHTCRDMARAAASDLGVVVAEIYLKRPEGRVARRVPCLIKLEVRVRAGYCSLSQSLVGAGVEYGP
jgi:hypothetical protein